MTTFTLVNTETADGDPAVINLNAPTQDNLLVAIVNERSGTGHAAQTVTDANGGTWTKRVGHNQEITDPNARQSMSVWTKIASATDAAGAFNVTADDGTANSKRLSIFEYAPSAAYAFNFEAQSSADTGTGATPPISSGTTADPGVGDLFVVGVVTWRSGTPPTSPTFTNLDGTDTYYDGGSNSRSHASSFSTSGQASGGKSTDADWTVSTDSEAICAILVFSASGGGGGDVLFGQALT